MQGNYKGQKGNTYCYFITTRNGSFYVISDKTTRKDNNRSKYVENGYSLPPVVLNTPQAPVRLEGQSIVVGGVSKN